MKRLSFGLVAILLIIAISVTLIAESAFTANSVSTRLSKTRSSVEFSGRLDTLITLTSNSYSIYEFNKHEDILGKLNYGIKITKENSTDTVGVAIHEYASLDGVNYALLDTIYTATASGYFIVQQDLINSRFDYRKIAVTNTASDSILFNIKLYINYK